MQANSKRIEQRFEYKLTESLLLSFYEYLESKSLNEKKTEAYLNKEKETALLISYCRENDLLFDPLPFSTYLDEGAEQKVFHNTELDHVTKLNDAIFYVNWSQYIESILIHNILFPETAYELKGFVLINVTLYAVVEQVYIEPTSPTTITAIRTLMIEKGFVVKKRNDYINNNLGLIVEDLHEENVLTREGVLFFIDTVIYLK